MMLTDRPHRAARNAVAERHTAEIYGYQKRVFRKFAGARAYAVTDNLWAIITDDPPRHLGVGSTPLAAWQRAAQYADIL